MFEHSSLKLNLNIKKKLRGVRKDTSYETKQTNKILLDLKIKSDDIQPTSKTGDVLYVLHPKPALDSY